MDDTLYVLVAITGVESEPAAVAAIENLCNDEQDFEVLETCVSDPLRQNETATIEFLMGVDEMGLDN